METKTCALCGNPHRVRGSDICGVCRRSGSKKKCLADGCERLIDVRAKSCLWHRHLFQKKVYSECIECGALFGESRAIAVCFPCRKSKFVQCACGCGRYRRKYNSVGQCIEYVSGHSDNWIGKHAEPRKCAMCGTTFTPNFRKQILCSQKCSGAWNHLNAPNHNKQVKTQCAVCGKDIIRLKSSLKTSDPACSKECRYKIVSAKLTGPRTDTKRFALKRDGWKCVICGFDVIVHVHHIVAKRRNGENGTNALENLVTLCPNHHAMADRALISIAEMQGYVQRQEHQQAAPH